MTGDQMHIKSTFKKDFFWYALGSILPMFIGFIKTPVFTRHFDTEAFGQLGIVSISFSFLGMMLFSWISSCLWRYYSSYRSSEGLTILYSNLLFLFVISLILLGFIAAIWFMESDTDLIKELVFYSFLQLIFNQLFLAYMVVIRLTGKSRYYTVFQAIRALLSLSLALLLVFYFDIGISALVSSLVLIDVGSIVLLLLVNPAEIKAHFSQINKHTLKKLLR
jgi:O-antigen/teichoic acid export membrane protein